MFLTKMNFVFFQFCAQCLQLLGVLLSANIQLRLKVCVLGGQLLNISCTGDQCLLQINLVDLKQSSHILQLVICLKTKCYTLPHMIIHIYNDCHIVHLYTSLTFSKFQYILVSLIITECPRYVLCLYTVSILSFSDAKNPGLAACWILFKVFQHYSIQSRVTQNDRTDAGNTLCQSGPSKSMHECVKNST